jgi:hypothetical protein
VKYRIGVPYGSGRRPGGGSQAPQTLSSAFNPHIIQKQQQKEDGRLRKDESVRRQARRLSPGRAAPRDGGGLAVMFFEFHCEGSFHWADESTKGLNHN